MYISSIYFFPFSLTPGVSFHCLSWPLGRREREWCWWQALSSQQMWATDTHHLGAPALLPQPPSHCFLGCRPGREISARGLQSHLQLSQTIHICVCMRERERKKETDWPQRVTLTTVTMQCRWGFFVPQGSLSWNSLINASCWDLQTITLYVQKLHLPVRAMLVINSEHLDLASQRIILNKREKCKTFSLTPLAGP
jgi:hypothetical protein